MKTLSFFMLWLANLAALENRDGKRWWSHVKFLASDELRGPGRPARRSINVPLSTSLSSSLTGPEARACRDRRIHAGDLLSRASHRGRKVEPHDRPRRQTGAGPARRASRLRMRVEPPPQVEAPLVFAGYGLRVPEVGYDDLAGLDLRGKVAVYFTGGPTHIPGPLLAHYQAAGERWSSLKRAGATGIIAIQNPQGQDVPWERSKLARFLPGHGVE